MHLWFQPNCSIQWSLKVFCNLFPFYLKSVLSRYLMSKTLLSVRETNKKAWILPYRTALQDFRFSGETDLYTTIRIKLSEWKSVQITVYSKAEGAHKYTSTGGRKGMGSGDRGGSWPCFHPVTSAWKISFSSWPVQGLTSHKCPNYHWKVFVLFLYPHFTFLYCRCSYISPPLLNYKVICEKHCLPRLIYISGTT